MLYLHIEEGEDCCEGRRKGRECCLFWQQDVRSSSSRSHLCVTVWAQVVKFSALTFSSVTQEDELCLILTLSPLTCLGSCSNTQTGIMALYKIIYKIPNIYKSLCHSIDFNVEMSKKKDLWPSQFLLGFPGSFRSCSRKSCFIDKMHDSPCKLRMCIPRYGERLCRVFA